MVGVGRETRNDGGKYGEEHHERRGTEDERLASANAINDEQNEA